MNRIGGLGSIRLGTSLAAVSVGLLAIGCGGDDSDEPETLDTQAVIEQAGPATAGILGEQFGVEAGGSGVVIDADQGLVLTNAHVAEGLDKLEVKLGENPTPVPARIRGVAPCDDLAVIEMLRPLPDTGELTIADRTVERGEHVTALGFPANFQNFGEQSLQTVDGTVSNPGITVKEIDPDLPTYQDLIQHTAPTNAGNSGGPLVDDYGEVVGINTLTGGSNQENQLYAIDSAYVNTILPDLAAGNDRLRMGWDLRPFDTVDLRSEFKYFRGDELANAGISAAFADDFVRGLDLPNGMYVFWTDPGLPADKADIFGGDLITSIDGEPVTSESDVCDILQSQEPGATVQVNGYYVASTPKLNEIGDKWSVDMKLPEEEIPPAETTTTETTTESE